MKPLKKQLSLSLDSDIIDRMKDLAEEDGRPLSQYINLVLRNYLRNLDKSEPKEES